MLSLRALNMSYLSWRWIKMQRLIETSSKKKTEELAQQWETFYIFNITTASWIWKIEDLNGFYTSLFTCHLPLKGRLHD